MKWHDVKENFPAEIKTKGHGVCNILVCYPFAGIPRVEQCMLINNRILTYNDRDVTDIVTYWAYLPVAPNQ